MRETIYSSMIEMDQTGSTLVTQSLQKLIDIASEKQACLVLEPGIYLTASLFLKSNMEFYFEEGAILLGTTKEEEYPIIPTRVAGIEMDWYPAILNCIHVENVMVDGFGIIDGQGSYWWEKYWGKDQKGGMRQEYDAKGLRWACDYDCKRVRNVLVSNSLNITLKDFTSYHSGFWNIHILYSQHIHIDGLSISSAEVESPSTDGIDVDSSSHVLIENCSVACNDDSIVIKSGRDEDGRRVGIPCHDIVIQNCSLNAGYGVTIGSEVSGGIYNIQIQNISYHGTDCGFRIKSSLPRQGYIRNIDLNHLTMVNVKYLFHIDLNWNSSYCECVIPKTCKDTPSYYSILTATPKNQLFTLVDHIKVNDVKAWYDSEYQGISRAFHMIGYEKQPLINITFTNLDIRCKEYGIISYAKNLHFEQCDITVTGDRQAENDVFDNR